MSKTTEKLLRNMDKALLREQMVEKGFYNRANHRVHKDKSKYQRHAKHKSRQEAEA